MLCNGAPAEPRLGVGLPLDLAVAPRRPCSRREAGRRAGGRRQQRRHGLDCTATHGACSPIPQSGAARRIALASSSVWGLCAATAGTGSAPLVAALWRRGRAAVTPMGLLSAAGRRRVPPRACSRPHVASRGPCTPAAGATRGKPPAVPWLASALRVGPLALHSRLPMMLSARSTHSKESPTRLGSKRAGQARWGA